MPPSLTKSAQKIAAYFAAHAEQVVGLTLAQLALQLKLSEPTIVRYCQAQGYDGYKSFMLQWAQQMAQRKAKTRNVRGAQSPQGTPYIHQHIARGDSPRQLIDKIFQHTQHGLQQLQQQFDTQPFDRATLALAKAARIECYGLGNSGIVAQDAAHKFFRLGVPSIAIADPHIHSVSAALLGKRDVVICFSNSGRTQDICFTAQQAQQAGACVIAITAACSPLAQLADIVLTVNPTDDPDLYAPMVSRIAHLVMIDCLAIAVALAKGNTLAPKLAIYKTIISQKRSPNPSAASRQLR